MSDYEQTRKGIAIANAALKQQQHETKAMIELGIACALLTSTVKAEREKGKAMVREWKRLS